MRIRAWSHVNIKPWSQDTAITPRLSRFTLCMKQRVEVTYIAREQKRRMSTYSSYSNSCIWSGAKLPPSYFSLLPGPQRTIKTSRNCLLLWTFSHVRQRRYLTPFRALERECTPLCWTLAHRCAGPLAHRCFRDVDHIILSGAALYECRVCQYHALARSAGKEWMLPPSAIPDKVLYTMSSTFYNRIVAVPLCLKCPDPLSRHVGSRTALDRSECKVIAEEPKQWPVITGWLPLNRHH